MLTDVQLKELAVKMQFPLESVTFKDELPSKLKYNVGYIINLENELDDKGEPNSGSHWTCFQIQKGKDGIALPIYFDPFGVAAPVVVSEAVEKFCGKKLPHTTPDIQALMANCCGWYCAAFLYFINTLPSRSGHIYTDTTGFIDCFEDLNVSKNFKKNELILKYFFRNSDPAKRGEISIGDAITNF